MKTWMGGLALALTASGLGVAHRLGRSYGAVPAERTASLPGDRLVPRPDVVCTHAITIDAPPERVWPWLQQVGWHRGGWYTARWVDRLLFPDHWASTDDILPEYQHLAVGDFIPDGSPETGCGFTVVELETARLMLLDSTTHLPRSWRDRNIGALHWTWAFVLTPLAGGRTRFVFRWRGRIDPWWLRVFCHAVIVPADFLMSRDMMRGLRRRAEGAGTLRRPVARRAERAARLRPRAANLAGRAAPRRSFPGAGERLDETRSDAPGFPVGGDDPARPRTKVPTGRLTRRVD